MSTPQFVAWYMATKEQRAEIARYFLLTENWSYDRLAAYLGVSRNVIAGVCNRNGIRISSRALKNVKVHPLDKVEAIPAFLPVRDNVIEFKPPTSQPVSREEAVSDMLKKQSEKLRAKRRASEQTNVAVLLATREFDATQELPPELKPRPTNARAWDALPDLVPVPLVDLKAHDCRWPIGDHTGTFCGARAMDGKVYCSTHAALAYKPAPPIKFKKKPKDVRRYG